MYETKLYCHLHREIRNACFFVVVVPNLIPVKSPSFLFFFFKVHKKIFPYDKEDQNYTELTPEPVQ